MMNRILQSLILFLIPAFGVAQQVSLYQQFLGKYDFTMIGNTLNTIPNGVGAPCTILTSSSANLNLTPNQNIEAAYLYWGGSGGNSVFDFNIKLNGVNISPNRTFSTDITGLGTSGGFADVTAQVLATGNGVYTVSDFDLTGVIGSYCGNGTNFGGWSILIIYSDVNLTNNLVNIYDGFTRVDQNNTYVQFELQNLNVLHLTGNRIGFLSWEGDQNIAVQEMLKINGNIVSNPPLNPANNVFNGTNSFTNSNNLYNMDLDYFDISGYTNIGDNSMVVSVESHQDAVILNNLVVVLNSEVPDATIVAQAQFGECDNREVIVDYTVSNIIATDVLPAGVPIAFYADDQLVGQSATNNVIPIGGSEDGNIVLTIPIEIANPFTLKVVVDDDGNGNSTVIEFDEENNEYEIEVRLGITPTVNPFEDLQKCDTNNDGFESFDLNLVGNQMLGNQTDVLIRYYVNQSDADAGNGNNITNPAAYTNQTNPQTIYVRMEDPVGCFVVASFQIEILPGGLFGYDLPDIEQCSSSMATSGILIDLTQNQNSILNGNDPNDFAISYHQNQDDAMSGINPIPNPAAYSNTTTPETIWARMVGPDGCVQYGSFQIILILPEEMNYEIPDLEYCSDDQILTGIQTDLTVNETSILNGNNPDDFVISYHHNQTDAANGNNPIQNPGIYQNQSSPETIWVRMISVDGCVLYGSFELTYNAPPIAYPAEISECSMSGPALFNLLNINPLIVDDTNGLEFSYYLSLNDAQNQTNPLPSNYTPPTQSFIIFARIENEKDCFTIVEVNLESVVNVGEITNTYFECDSPWEINDGITEFDLTQLNNQILGVLSLNSANISFHQTAADAINGNNPVANPQSYLNTTNPQTMYARAVGTDGNCGGIVEFNIEVLPVPEFELPDYLAFCDYDPNKTFTFENHYHSYIWTNPEGEIISTTASVQFDGEGIYTLELRETADGCPAKREFEVIIDQAPVILDVKVEENTVTVFASGGHVPYQYSIDNGLTWSDNYILNDVPGGLYDILVRSKYGCIGDSKFFGVLGAPNFISPNGDGRNDYWSVRGLEAYPSANIKIFDRYGKMFVDRQLGPDFRWDGRYKGDPVASGDYWYIITFEDGKRLSGHITVRNY